MDQGRMWALTAPPVMTSLPGPGTLEASLLAYYTAACSALWSLSKLPENDTNTLRNNVQKAVLPLGAGWGGGGGVAGLWGKSGGHVGNFGFQEG